MPVRKNKTYTGIEKRQNKRLPFWTAASFSEIQFQESATSLADNNFFASGVNISKNGMLLETYEKIKPGTVLKINVEREDQGEHYNFIGKVMHSGKTYKSGLQGLGIEFIKRPRHLSSLLK